MYSSTNIWSATWTALLLYPLLLASQARAELLDIDGNRRADALTDGIILVRHLFGLSGSALTAGAVAPDATRDTQQISDYLNGMDASVDLDVDGNGHVDALTDGIILVRYLFGFSGNTLTQGALGAGATRTTPSAIVGSARALARLPEPAPIPVQPPAPKKIARVVLLLHGMSSDANTWNDFVDREAAFDGNGDRCPTIFDGVIQDWSFHLSRESPPALSCFRVRFGAHDGWSGRVGVEGVRAHGPRSGDFSTFDQLGSEIGDAVRAIKHRFEDAYPNVELRIALVAHSRGGLAARAFLQGSGREEEKRSIVALLTTGTPHLGSPLGRIHRYLRDYCLNADGSRYDPSGFFGLFSGPCHDDWQVVDFLRSRSNCLLDSLYRFFTSEGDPEVLDVRRPTIDDLSDRSWYIDRLLTDRGRLPANVEYAALKYTGVELGRLASNYRIFDLWGIDPCDQVSKQAEGYLLYPSGSNRGVNLGDGIVPFESQMLPSLRKVTYAEYGGDTGTLHIEEPKRLTRQQADISFMLNYILDWKL